MKRDKRQDVRHRGVPLDIIGSQLQRIASLVTGLWDKLASVLVLLIVILVLILGQYAFSFVLLHRQTLIFQRVKPPPVTERYDDSNNTFSTRRKR